MKFIHIADVHMGCVPDQGKIWSNDRAEEIHNTFVKVTKVCEEQNIDVLLIAGDLFDSQPTEKQLKELDFRLKQMRGTKTVIIAGSSDYITEDNRWDKYEFSSDVKVLEPDKVDEVYFEDLKLCVRGFSYGKEKYSERILETIRPSRKDEYNILLGYGGEDDYMPFAKQNLARLGFDYIALGHSHKPSHMLKNRMAYAGSLEPLGVEESGKRGYILGEVDENNNTTISFVPFSRRIYFGMNISVSSDNTNEDILDIIDEQIRKNGNQNIYKITIKGNLSPDVGLNLSALTRRYNIYEIVDESKSEYNVSELYSDNQSNILGRYIKELSKSDNIENKEIRYKALRYGIDALLEIGEK